MYFVHSLARTQPNATHTYKHFCLCPHCIIHVTLHEELYQQKSGTLRRLEQGTHDSLSSCIIVRDLFCFKEDKILKLHVTQSGLGVYNQQIQDSGIHAAITDWLHRIYSSVPWHRRVFSFLLVPQPVCDGPRKLGLKPSVATWDLRAGAGVLASPQVTECTWANSSSKINTGQSGFIYLRLRLHASRGTSRLPAAVFIVFIYKILFILLLCDQE